METQNTTPITFDTQQQNGPLSGQITEIWQYRHLIGNLIARDLKVRYKRSILGFFWTMLNPLLTMAVLAVVFSAIFRFNVENYIAYLLIGLLLWNFFSQATSGGMESVFINSGVLTKIYVPPSAFTLAAVGSGLVNLAFATGPMMVVAILTGIRPSWEWFYIIIPILQVTLVSAGIAFILATLRVFFQDMVDIYAVFLNLFFYLNPIIYPLDMLPVILQRLQTFNPFYYPLIGARTALMDNILPPLEITVFGFLYGFALLSLGWLFFARFKREFTYHI